MTTQTAVKKVAKKVTKLARKVLNGNDKAGEIATLVERFNTAKADIKDAAARKAQAELEIRAMLQDNVAISVNGVERIKLRYGTNSSVDRDLLSEAFPEAFQACNRTTAYDYIHAT